MKKGEIKALNLSKIAQLVFTTVTENSWEASRKKN